MKKTMKPSTWVSQLLPWSLLVTCSQHLLFLCTTGSNTVLGYQLNGTGMIQDVKYNHVTGAPCNNCTKSTKFRSHNDLMQDREAIISEDDLPPPEVDVQTCVIQGQLKYSQNWYGYLAIIKTIPEGGKFYFKFTYPQHMCCMKLLIYLTEDVDILRARMTCMQKQATIHPQSDQFITLSPTSKHSGCTTLVSAEGKQLLECRSGRLLKSKDVREWYIAVSNCGSPTGLDFEYSLVVFGHVGKCPESTTDSKAMGLQYSCLLLIVLLNVSKWL